MGLSVRTAVLYGRATVTRPARLAASSVACCLNGSGGRTRTSTWRVTVAHAALTPHRSAGRQSRAHLGWNARAASPAAAPARSAAATSGRRPARIAPRRSAIRRAMKVRLWRVSSRIAVSSPARAR